MDDQQIEEKIIILGLKLQSSGVVIDRLILFGSSVQGTRSETSDIDLIIVSDSFIKLTLWQRAKIVGKFIGSMSMPFEVLMLTKNEYHENRFAQEITRQAKVIHLPAA